MPWGDWQFWVVTLAAALGVYALVRVVRPKSRRSQRTEITIKGRKRGS